MRRVIGFAMMGAAVVGWLLVVANAEYLFPAGAWMLSLRESVVYTHYREGAYPDLGALEDCTRFDFGRLFAQSGPSCEERNAERIRVVILKASGTSPPPEVAYRLNLGNALAAIMAVAFVGAGLLLFWRRQQP